MTQSSMDIETRSLPAEWKWVKLGDVCGKSETIDPRKSPGRLFTYIDISSVDRNTKRIVSPGSILGKDAPSRARRLLKSEDILVSTTRPNLNAVALVDSSLNGEVCSTGFCVLRTKPTANSNYIFHFVRSQGFINSLSGLVSGALYPAVTDNQVYQQVLPLPPLEEQKRIAAILDEQIAEVEKAKKASVKRLEAAKALPAAYLWEVFEGEKTKSWPTKSLGDLAERITDGTHQSPQFTDSGIPFLFVKNIVSGEIDFNVAKYISDETYEALTRNWKPAKGDVLYSAVGSFGVAVTVDTDVPFLFQRHIAIIKPFGHLIESKFLKAYINSSAGRRQSDASALGGAQRTVSLGLLSKFQIPCPPVAEQRRITSNLDEQFASAMLAEESIQQELETIQAIPAALVRTAFAGEL